MTAADRPRVGDQIATAEQLDALPDGTLILDQGGEFWLRGSGQWWGHTGDTAKHAQQIEVVYGIEEVLHVPGEPSRPSVTDNARADLHPVVTEHQIIGTQTGKQGAGQVVPEDSVLCIRCGWMRCSDYTWHLSDALTAAGPAETTTEDPESRYCGRGICAAPEGHAGTCAEASGWDHDWRDDSAETTTATDEDALDAATDAVEAEIIGINAGSDHGARDVAEAAIEAYLLARAETATATVEDAARLLWEKFGARSDAPLSAWLTLADCNRFAQALADAGLLRGGGDDR